MENKPCGTPEQPERLVRCGESWRPQATDEVSPRALCTHQYAPYGFPLRGSWPEGTDEVSPARCASPVHPVWLPLEGKLALRA